MEIFTFPTSPIAFDLRFILIGFKNQGDQGGILFILHRRTGYDGAHH